jgi:type II secretion system protein J
MRQNRDGFTLVETLVALVILMIVVGAVYGVFRTASQSATLTEERTDVYQTARVLLMQINTELSSGCQLPGSQQSSLTGEDTEGSATADQHDKLTFLTASHRMLSGSGPAGDMCQVTYTVETTPDGEALGLSVVEDSKLGLGESDVKQEPTILSKLVVGMNCTYLDGDTGEWQDEWTDRTGLPKAVRVELILKPERKGAKPITVASTANLPAVVPAESASDGPTATPTTTPTADSTPKEATSGR